MEFTKLTAVEIESKDNVADLTSKFQSMVSYDKKDFYRFQNYVRHIMFNPEYHKKCDSVGEAKRCYWKGSRLFDMKMAIDIDPVLEKYLHVEEANLTMFKDHEKFKAFWTYFLDTTKKRARSYAVKDVNMSFPIGSFSSSVIVFDDAFLKLEVNYMKKLSSYNVFSSRPYSTYEPSADSKLLEEAAKEFEN